MQFNFSPTLAVFLNGLFTAFIACSLISAPAGLDQAKNIQL
jgi:hypothetical protein